MPTTAGEWLAQILVFVLVGYPIVGGLAFIVSSIYYFAFLEKRDRPRYLEHGEPFVTIFVPAHNESARSRARSNICGTRSTIRATSTRSSSSTTPPPTAPARSWRACSSDIPICG
ncbi:hypothetical protein GCM10011575_08270 [Microlunatus endophyticus]|uniref:Uncharacterized protein n=1 Tax=Microlunatus endophyticus TaxID=1716077 RepID=A0A917S2M0_9ACTN|nr:hypothetical protein GCM10011575_08270 [Microlunatus endophyticus]